MPLESHSPRRRGSLPKCVQLILRSVGTLLALSQSFVSSSPPWEHILVGSFDLALVVVASDATKVATAHDGSAPTVRSTLEATEFAPIRVSDSATSSDSG
jgi:hypothetical protein